VQHDDQLVKDYGVKLATNMVKKLAENGINGVNFCTLNLEKSVQLILEGLQWTAYHDGRHWNKLINVSVPCFREKCPFRTSSFPLDDRPRAFVVGNGSDDISP
jgi:hypothetical protein